MTDRPDRDYMTDRSMGGASPWERDLYAHLTSHADAERGILEKYSKVAEQTESKAFRYLVNLLIDDEIRHHRFFADIANSLKTEATMSGEDPVVPYLDLSRADSEGLRECSRELLENEERDMHTLRRLERELKDVKDTTLWELLVELMQRDTDKHIAILRFVEKHAGS
jgi:rubrerythrin